MISAGLLRRARARLHRLIPHLGRALVDGVTVVGLEPSELLVYRDEALDLMVRSRQPLAGRVAAHAQTFEEFIAAESVARRLVLPELGPHPQPMVLHVHCHQRALVGIDSSAEALRLLPGAEIHTLGPGCCGMAGAFGYAEEHFDLSKCIGERLLSPLRDARPDETTMVATGASCRQQIRDLMGIEAVHTAEILDASLAQ
jgi:Fe-S oxidoreductase